MRVLEVYGKALKEFDQIPDVKAPVEGPGQGVRESALELESS